MHRFVVIWLALLAAAPAYAAEQLSHYVDYQVELKNLPAGASGDGLWQMGTIGTCKAWKVTQLANLNVKAGDRASTIVLTQQADETADGLKGDYVTQIAANGQQIAIKASVSLPSGGGAGKMDTSVGPNSIAHSIPGGTLLLAKASQAMLDKLAAGEKDFTLKVVEPTAPEGVADLRVQVLSQSPFSDTKLPVDNDGALAGKSWVVRFTKAQPNGAQDATMLIYESGVIARIMMEMSGIHFEMTARNIKIFPKPAC